MTEIAQFFETALRQNRANLLRRAAINTVAKMPADTTLRELLESEAGATIRALTLKDLGEALAEVDPGTIPEFARRRRKRPRIVAVSSARSDSDDAESREARIYREIMEAVRDEPMTIGQLAKKIQVDTIELRGYLAWMKKMGKIASSGRARATRYQIPPH